MKTALAVVLALLVLALVVKKAFEVADPDVIELGVLLDQQDIDPRHVFGLFADVVTITPLSHPKTLMARLFCHSTL